MALVRILLDGNGLLHHWTQLAPGKPPESAAAREELVHKLTQYYDACGTPMTVVFSGVAGPSGGRERTSTMEVEILFSPAGKPAGQMIERMAHRLRSTGEVLVVTPDKEIHDLVAAGGGKASSCQDFIHEVENCLAEVERQIQILNQKERLKFNNAA